MPNYLLIIEYDGSRFSGWQKQPRLRTVQSEFDKACAVLLGRPLKSAAAGRTDAGVHARGQAVSVSGRNPVDPEKLGYALNALLPDDISVVSASKVKPGFNARHRAKEKTYAYRIWNNALRSIWAQKISWQIKYPLNLRKAKLTANAFVGRHDYRAFASAGGGQEETKAYLRSLRIHKKDGFTVLEFIGNRFLYRMVRNIAGAIVEAARGKIIPADVKKALKTGKREFQITTAPAHGLTLEKVRF